MKRHSVLLAFATILLFGLPEAVAGYVGPGAGLTVIGAALAFVGAVVMGIFGFIWYPFKRFFRALTRKGEEGRSLDDS
jgi:hypothetical protein